MAPPAYARLTRFALWALAAIVVTGVSVRLTGSGLGCEDWPTCSEDRFVADLEYHALVEFVNRLFTGVVAIAVMAAVLGSWRRRPRRADLIALSLGLVVGVLAQVALGALLVKTELDPRFTMGHFLLSMVLLWNAAVLDVRARSDTEESTNAGNPSDTDDSATAGGASGSTPGDRAPDGTTRLMLWAVLVVGAALLVTGTLVTGAGPHAGDTRAERLPLLVREVARIHSIVALLLLGMVVWTWWRLRSSSSAGHIRMGRIAVLLAVQGAIGYTQYFTGVPVLLVGVHVTLASITWIEIVKAAHDPGTWPRQRDPLETAPMAGVQAMKEPEAMGSPVTSPVKDPVDETDRRPDLPWKVIVLDDPVNLMSYVTYVFRKLFGYSQQKAHRLMMQVHTEGKAVVASGQREKAEFDVYRLHEHGLWAILEQD